MRKTCEKQSCSPPFVHMCKPNVRQSRLTCWSAYLSNKIFSQNITFLIFMEVWTGDLQILKQMTHSFAPCFPSALKCLIFEWHLKMGQNVLISDVSILRCLDFRSPLYWNHRKILMQCFSKSTTKHNNLNFAYLKWSFYCSLTQNYNFWDMINLRGLLKLPKKDDRFRSVNMTE